MPSIEVYHTQEFRPQPLTFPALAEGLEQWLGDGYYFWQDLEFAHWWGHRKKNATLYSKYSIFKVTLNFELDDFIDTVFNEHDYYNFVKVVEYFAKAYHYRYKRKPSLEEFNDFIEYNGIWNNIKIIRFQDLPITNDLLMVKGYYYKKRIQIRVNEPENIVNFVFVNDFTYSKKTKL